MDPSEKKRAATLHGRRRQHRISMSRQRTAALSVVLFVFLWAVLFVQMVSGHDPVLDRTKAVVKVKEATGKAPTRRQESAATTVAPTYSQAYTQTPTYTQTQTPAPITYPPAPVTTSQS